MFFFSVFQAGNVFLIRTDIHMTSRCGKFKNGLSIVDFGTNTPDLKKTFPALTICLFLSSGSHFAGSAFRIPALPDQLMPKGFGTFISPEQERYASALFHRNGRICTSRLGIYQPWVSGKNGMSIYEHTGKEPCYYLDSLLMYLHRTGNAW